MKIYKDGNMWCVVQDGFKNLQESPALFMDQDEYLKFRQEMVQPFLDELNKTGFFINCDGSWYRLHEDNTKALWNNFMDKLLEPNPQDGKAIEKI